MSPRAVVSSSPSSSPSALFASAGSNKNIIDNALYPEEEYRQRMDAGNVFGDENQHKSMAASEGVLDVNDPR